LFLNSHFFILPVQAESYGHVFCEAQGFALPCLTHQTGGIASIIKHQKTGWCLPPNTPIQGYGQLILDTFRNPEKYQTIAQAAYQNYKTALNWQTACHSLIKLLETL